MSNTIKKFRVEVTLTTEVIVEVDEAIWTPERMAEFRKDFYQFNTLEAHAEHIAQYAVRFDTPDFLEGYGPIEYKSDGKVGIGTFARKPDGCQETGIALTVGAEDVDTVAWEQSK